jgi:hypothetical protein
MQLQAERFPSEETKGWQEACVICGGQDKRIARHARSLAAALLKRVRQAIARRDRHVAPARMLC